MARADGPHRHLEVAGRPARVMARRLNIDGDGQGDLDGHGGEKRAVLVYQVAVLRVLAAAPRPRRPRARPVRGELHRRRPARRRGVHRRPLPHRRGRVRGHPAARHLLPRRACAWASPACPRCSSPTTAPASTCGSSPRAASRPATRSSGPRVGRHADERRRHRRAALPARTATSRQLRTAAGHPRAQPRLAAVLPRPASTPPTATAADRPAVGVEPGGPVSAGCASPGSSRRAPPSRRSTWRPTTAHPLPAAQPGQYLTLRVTGAGRPAPRYAATRCPPPRARTSYRISVKREPHGLVSGYLAHRAAPRRRARRRRARAATSCWTTATARCS